MPRYIYGPVKSRRLGLSLGADIVPMKTCCFDCIYCQLGSGYRPTVTRGRFVPLEKVIEQIGARLEEIPRVPDYITIGGSGEPTLNESFGDLASALRKEFDIPVCLLTNGSLMWLEQVRAACTDFDLIVPGLDACDESMFQAVNRPHGALSFEKLLTGLERLREEFKGAIWLEVFLIPGLNTSEQQCRRFKKLAERLKPDKIHLNTAVRPPAESSVRPLCSERMQQIRRFFGPKAESIASLRPRLDGHGGIKEEEIIGILHRRPCTAGDIASAYDASVAEAEEKLQKLISRGKVNAERRDGKVFYMAN